jgi:ubiquinone/menaquinone biosynthesis C-methylase UbiE
LSRSAEDKYARREVELAEKLQSSDAKDRKTLYTEIYEELYTFYSDGKRRDLCEHYLEHSSYSNDFVLKLLPPKSTVLEVGSGFGHASAAFARAGHRVSGIDINRIHVREAEELYGSIPGLDFQFMNACELDFKDESFDLVTSKSVYEHIHPDDIDRHLAEVERVLKRGGAYVVFTTTSTGNRGDICECTNDPKLRGQRGLHINEGSWRDIRRQFSRSGLTARTNIVPRRFEKSLGKTIVLVPLSFKASVEPLVKWIPPALRILQMRDVTIVARKPL